MAAFTGNGYLVDDLAALTAIPAVDRPAFKVALLVAGLGWYEYDNTATSGGVTPDDSPASGRWFPVSRETLRANRTYYVRTDGSDSNTGLANTSGGAFLTIQKAVDIVAALDLGVFQAIIQIADGTYSVSTPILLKQALGNNIIIQGNISDPSLVVVESSADFVDRGLFSSVNIATKYIIKALTLTSTHSNVYFLYAEGSPLNFESLRFGSHVGIHIRSVNNAVITADANYSIVGSGTIHISCANKGMYICEGRTVTLTGTPSFSSTFCSCRVSSVVRANSTTYSGSATGVRYNIQENSVVFVNGAGVNFFPGNSAGSTATGAQYV